MSELSKRIYTSILLLLILLLAIFNNFILFISLIFCFYQIFFEFYNLIKKTLKKKHKVKFFFILLIILTLLTHLIVFIWISLNSNDSFNKIFLLFIMSVTIATDIGGFVFGKIFKGKKLTKISPKKTYSGMLGSFITSFITAYIIFQYYFELSYLLLFILIISSVSQFGDIFISFLKRKNNLKDTGNILPGHGGFLDRFDGLIFALLIGSFIKIFI